MDELGDVLLVDGEVGHVDAVLPQAPRVLAVVERQYSYSRTIGIGLSILIGNLSTWHQRPLTIADGMPVRLNPLGQNDENKN